MILSNRKENEKWKSTWNTKTYIKDGNKWILEKERPTTEISEQRYLNLKNEKLKGDRRQFYYSYEFGEKLMTRLTNTRNDLNFKSVRTFEFKK